MTTPRQAPELSPGLETFLESAGRGFLVTRRQDGSPTTHPLTPLWADGAIHFNTYRKSAKVRNLLRHPRVACVVTSADDDPSYFALECRGTAVVLDLADIPDSILGVDDNGEVMDAADLARVRENVASGKRIYLRVVPEEWTVCEPLAPERRASARSSAPDPAALAGALVPSHIAMTAEEADGVPAPEARRRSGHGRCRGQPQRTPCPLHRGAGRPALDGAPVCRRRWSTWRRASAAAATVEEFPSYDDIRGVMAHGPTRFFVDPPTGEGGGGVDRSRSARRPARELRLQQDQPRPLSGATGGPAT